MKTVRKNVEVGENLSGKTLYFDFTDWTTYTTSSSLHSTELIRVDNSHYIYVYRLALFGDNERLYIVDGETVDSETGETEKNIINIATMSEDGLTVHYDSYTLSSDYGTVTDCDKYEDVYKMIYHDVPLSINYNGSNVEKVVYKGNEVKEIYFNGKLVF